MSGLDKSRILIVRLSAIGDVLHALPVLNALRSALPEAFIAWMVEGRTAELIRDHAALDQVICVRRGWLKSPSTVLQVRRSLCSLRFDIALDVQGLTKSALAAGLSGARQRVGFAGKDGRELSTWLNNDLVRPTASHVIDRNLELLKPLGIVAPTVRFDLPERAEDTICAERLISGLGFGSFVVVNPGAGWPSKIWPAQRYAAVTRHLEARGLPTLVVWAGSAERAMAAEIVAGSSGSARLAPSTSLRELAAVVRRARLFVGSDTGPLHLAVAVGTPSIGLFGPMPSERNGPYGSEHIAVQEVCLSGTSRQRRAAGPESMNAISVDRVCAACDEILSHPRRARQSA